MRAERELMRGAGPVAVLKLLESGPKYGYELVQLLAERSDGVLAMGQSTLYPLVYNLESGGYIRAQWRTADTGRDRKYYALTAKGRRRLAKDARQWQQVAAAMQSLGILQPNSAAPSASRLAAGATA